MNKKRLSIVIAAAVYVLGVGVWYVGVYQADEVPASSQNASMEHEARSSAQSQKVVLHPEPEYAEALKKDTAVLAQTPKALPGKAFAPSIEGTQIDGSLKADVDGNLIIDLEVRDLFDYFMNTVADVPPDVALGELEKLAREHLPEGAANQAMALLEDYLAYKEAALTYAQKPLLPPSEQTPEYQLSMLEESFTQLKEIRRATMSREAVDAFFALEEAYGEYTLAQIRIQTDASLSPEARNLALNQARANLPPMLRNSEIQMQADLELTQEVDLLMQSGISDEELARALREKGIAASSVDDAINYRRAQREFDAQYTDYALERDQLRASGLSDKDIESELESLRQKYFDSEQGLTQARVRDLNS